MNNLKRVLSIALGGIILVGTTSLGATGIVNAPNGLILRKEASKSGEVVMTISDNSKVQILEENGEWYKVKYNSHEGYLFSEYVEVKEEEPKEEEQEISEKQTEKTKTEETENTENKEKQYPEKQKIKSNIKIYSIPSVTAKTIATAKKDAEITINYELNNWVNITYGKNTGWARKYFVNNGTKTVETSTDNKEKEVAEETKKEENKTIEETVKVIDNKKGYVDVSNSANIRKKASTSSDIIDTLLRNTEVTIIAEEGDFYKIKYQDITGYISKSLVSEKPVEKATSRSSGERKVSIPENDKDTQTKKSESTSNKKIDSNSSKGNNVVSYAKKYVGYDYVSGGTTPSTGFDCSGFTYYVFNACGYSLSRSCQVQAKSGTAVSKENLSAGDLVFFDNGSNGSIGHVGIYIGGGQFVHAENSRTGVRIDTINSGYYNKYYYSARRIIN